MAKQVYKIPASLDKGRGDTEIAVRSDSAVGFRPYPIKYVIAWVVSLSVMAFVLLNPPIGDGPLLWKFLTGIFWFAMTALLLRRDSTDMPQASLVKTIGEYWPSKNRYVLARHEDNLGDFQYLSGIAEIDPDRGLIKWEDGSYGFAFRVVGNASRLLFEEDKQDILDRTDRFFRNMSTDYELIFTTVKAPQNVVYQMRSLKDRYDRMTANYDDPDLRDLAEAEYQELYKISKGEFRTIHQYLIIKAANVEALKTAQKTLMTELRTSSLVLKQCDALFGEDLYALFGRVYKGKEVI